MHDRVHYIITFNTWGEPDPGPLGDWIRHKAASLDVMVERASLGRLDGNDQGHALLVVEDLTGTWTEGRLR